MNGLEQDKYDIEQLNDFIVRFKIALYACEGGMVDEATIIFSHEDLKEILRLMEDQIGMKKVILKWRKPDMVVDVEDIQKLQPINSKPKTGHWEKTTDEYCYWYKCSCCGTKTPKNEWGSDYFSPYCPECGAKMVESQESEE